MEREIVVMLVAEACGRRSHFGVKRNSATSREKRFRSSSSAVRRGPRSHS
jgi:hypothetical protein